MALTLCKRFYLPILQHHKSISYFIISISSPCPAEWAKGHELAMQVFRRDSNFSTESYTAANRRNFMFIKGSDQQVATAPGSDTAANLENYIPITPMRADFTDHKVLHALKAIE